MKLIFWNTKKINDFRIIISILNDESPDFLFLAEFNHDELNSHMSELNIINYEHFLNPGCDKILIIKKKEITDIDLSLQHKDYSAIYIKSIDVHIISLHMPSQLNYGLDALKHNLSEFKFQFETHIGNSEQKSILLIGDFNVNPFEAPIVNYDGLSATNTTNFNVIKVFRSQENHIYYNPTWKLYSNINFPGTFRKVRPSNSVFDVIDHHYLDQVILSHKLLKRITNEDISTLLQTSEYDIFNIALNKIMHSDHLPIKYEFQL
jgi:exonuclease III